MPLDLEPIKARLAGISEAPWTCLDRDGYWYIYGANGFQIHNTFNSSDIKIAEANRRLIEHAPTDLAALIQEVERLRAENEGLNAEIDHADSQYRRLSCETRAALERYGQHTASCERLMDAGRACSCGLDGALLEIAEGK